MVAIRIWIWIRKRIATLVRHALAEVCTVTVLLVIIIFYYYWCLTTLQCFDAVSWAAGRASDL